MQSVNPASLASLASLVSQAPGRLNRGYRETNQGRRGNLVCGSRGVHRLPRSPAASNGKGMDKFTAMKGKAV